MVPVTLAAKEEHMQSDSVFSSHQFPGSLPDLRTAAYIIGHPCGSQGSSHQSSVFLELAHLGVHTQDIGATGKARPGFPLHLLTVPVLQ